MPSSENADDSLEACSRLDTAREEILKLNMLDEARLEIVELRKSVGRKRFGIEAVQDSDKDVNFYTGLPSAAVFDRLFEYLSPGGKRSNVVYRTTALRWISDCAGGIQPGEAECRDSESQVGQPGSLSQADELFLVLVRLHLDLKEYDLARRFDISQFTVSRIFLTWINYCYLRLGMLPCWPDRDTIKDTMPAVFKEQYPRTTVIWMPQRSKLICHLHYFYSHRHIVTISLPTPLMDLLALVLQDM